MDKNDVRRQLNLLGKRPLRFIGQHFLTDATLVQRCVEWAQVVLDGIAVEIGPGLGSITRALLERGALVYAIELDAQLLVFLKTTLGKEFPGQLFLHAGDAVALPLAGLSPKDAELAKVIANLPFSISSPWLDALFAGPLPLSLTLFLQRETAERLLAKAPSRNRSALGVRLSSAYRLIHSLVVPPEAFHPRPRVEAQLIHWERLPEPFYFSSKCYALMRHCFLNRRKLLRSALRSLTAHPLFADVQRWFVELSGQGWEESTLRAEELTDQDWQILELHLRTKGTCWTHGAEIMLSPGGWRRGN